MTGRSIAAMVGAGVLVLLSACSGPDTSAVATEAQAPFVCDGVPAKAAELILGGAVVETRSFGQWGREKSGFQCDVKLASSDSQLIAVEEWDVATRMGGDSDNALRVLAAQTGAEKIIAQADGAGYVSGTPDAGSATWVCAGRMLHVNLVRVKTAGRDQRADAQTLLVSMLPWACGGKEAPARTATK